MKKITTLLLFILLVFYTHAQNNCSNAINLCANNKIIGSTAGGTASPSDPALSCGDGVVHHSIWYIVQGINTGTATVTVTQINNTPGLEMQVYTGSCGSLVPVGPCASGNGPNGSMSVNFPVTAGGVYYVMVDGTNGNQESFEVEATATGNSILARPDPNFNTNPSSGCNPLGVLLQNTTVINGGTNITYQWRINGIPYPSSGADTNIVLNGMGYHTVELRVCNSECGCKAVVQEVVVQDLVPVINYSPVTTCVGTPVNFSGSATIQPDPPFVNPVITSWFWNFGDPNSGVNNFSNLQNPTHTFVGPGNTFTVKLVVDGTCGPDSTTITVNLLQQPVVDAGMDFTICEGTTAILNSSVSNATLPVNFQWTGPGTINCDTCQLASVTGLAPGGPYNFVVSIVDANGCIASDTVAVTVNPTPIVDAGTDATVCRWSQFNLNATVITGNGPFTYSWNPPTGLDNPNIPNPVATVTGPITYCVTVTDSAGCVSSPDCIDIDVFPPPAITSASTSICAGDPPPLTNTFNVTGAGAGSTYSWTLSPDYPLITSANGDSSSVTATFPATPGSYNFTTVVADGVTGCVDTVSTTFTVDPPPVLSVNGPFTICDGETVNLTATGAASYNWSANPPYPFADPTLSDQTVTPGTSTTFVVTGTTGSCVVTDTIEVTVNPSPIAMVAPLSPICGCDSIMLDGSGSSTGAVTYNWTSSAGSAIDNPSQISTGAFACAGGTFTLTVTDTITGCQSSDGTTLSQTPNPDAAAQVMPEMICNGALTNVNLSGAGSNLDPGTVYNWSSTPAVPITNPSSLNTTATVSGTTTFTLTVTDSLGCDSSALVTVNIFPSPVISASPNSLCTSDPVQEVTISVAGAEPGSTYDWTIPGCVTPSTASGASQLFDFTGCGAGNYVFTVVVTGGINGCVDTLNIVIPIDSLINLTVSPDQTICEGDAVVLTASGAANFIWSTNDSTSSINVSPTLSGSPHTYTVVGYTGGCSDTASVIVTVAPIPPAPVISGLTTICENATNINYSVTSNPGSTYNWSVSGGVIVSGQGTSSITVDWGAAGSGSVTVVEVNSGNCPSIPVTVNININPAPVTSSITGPTTLCADSTGIYSVSGFSGSTYTWMVSGGVITSGQGTNTVNISWGAAGGGTITVTETSADGCQGTPQNLNVTLNSNPVTSSITGPDSLCASGSGIIYTVTSNAGSIYDWSVSGGTINSGQGTNTINVDWPSPPGGSVSVTETNSDGCVGAAVNLNIYIAEPPTASATATDTICRNEILILNGTAGSGMITWTTSGGGSFSNPNISNPTYTPSANDSGMVSFSMTVSNPPCADAVATVEVFINPSPTSLDITGPSALCEGASGTTYTVSFSAGSNYTWIVTGGTISSGQGTNTINVTWGAAGTGTVVVGDTNIYGCVSQPDTLNINISSIPATSPVSGDTVVCQGATGIMYSVPSNPGISYNWGISGGVITAGQGTNTITVDWTTAGQGTITLTETNSAGCVTPTQSFLVNVQIPPVTPSITGPLQVCTDTASVLYYVSSTSGSTYNWTVTGGTIISGQGNDSIYIVWSQPGQGSLTVVETSSGGCPGNQENINVNVNSLPVTSAIAGPTAICENTTGSIYSVSVSAGSSYNWQVTGGTLVGGQGTNTVTIDWGTAGFGTLTVTETSSAGCTGQDETINIIINGTPSVSITSAPPNNCEGQSISLTATGGPGTINWSANVPGTFTGGNTLTPSFNTNATGLVTFTITMTNAPCPSDSDQVSVLIHPNPVVNINAAQSTICEGDQVNLSASGALTYLWAPGGETSASITVSPLVSTIYHVTGIDSNGCQSSDTFEITVTPAALADAGSDVTLCSGLTVPVSGTINNATGGIWTSSGSGTFSPSNNSLVAFYNPTATDYQSGSVILYLTTQGGCTTDLDSITVTFVDGSDVDAGPDQQVPTGSNVQLAGSANTPLTVTWSTLGNGTFQPSHNNLTALYVPSHQDYLAGGVTLVLSNSFGCTDTVRITFGEFFIPNVITPLPHSAGHNDYFVIKGLPDNSQLLIFDRWGLKIYESSNYRNDWDAPNLPDDTYFYILTLMNGKQYNGIIRVIRSG